MNDASTRVRVTDVLLLIACGLIALSAITHRFSTTFMGGQPDFIPVYVAAQLYNDGDIEAIYDHTPYGTHKAEEWVAMESQAPNGNWQTVYPYTPVYLLPVAVLVKFVSYHTAVIVLYTFNAALVLALSVGLALTLPLPHLTARAGLVIFLCTAHAAVNVLWLGQNFMICLLGLALFGRDYMQGHNRRAVLWFLLANVSKPWAAAFLMLPFLRRDYKSTALYGCALILFFAAQYVWQPELVRGYIDITRSHTGITILAANNHSLSAGLTRLLVPGWTAFYDWTNAGDEFLKAKMIRYALIPPVVLVGWITRDDRLRAHATVLTLFLLGNVFWDFYGLLMLPFVMATILETERRTYRWLLLAAVFIMYWLSHIVVYQIAAETLLSRVSLRQAEVTVALYSLVPAALYGYSFVHHLRRSGELKWRERLFDFRSTG